MATKTIWRVGDRAGSPDSRGYGYDSIITVESIQVQEWSDGNTTQWLSGPDSRGRATTLQGCFCVRLKPRKS